MSAREVREAVATALTDVVPTGWVVYAKPPSAPSTPCVVVGPRNPYRVQETFASERVGFRVSVLMPPGADLDDLDEILDLLVPALWGIDALGVDQVSDVGTVRDDDNGAGYLSAGIDCWVI